MGAWIEILLLEEKKAVRHVAPLVGAWIEIGHILGIGLRLIVSLPSWERGLKLLGMEQRKSCTNVAPLVGAWIEIIMRDILKVLLQSLPSWERGLKSYKSALADNGNRRSPRGSVD